MSGIAVGVILFMVLAFAVEGQFLPAAVAALVAVPFGWTANLAWRDVVVIDESSVRLGRDAFEVGRNVVGLSVAEWELHHFGQPFVTRGHCVVLVGAHGEIIPTSLGSPHRRFVQVWITQICDVTSLPLVDVGPHAVSAVDWP